MEIRHTGEIIYDNNGKPIQAHGGCIETFLLNQQETYFWYGEDKTFDDKKTPGFRLYTSSDLKSWTDCGLVLKTAESFNELINNEYFKNLYFECSEKEMSAIFQDIYCKAILERPKVIYNKKNDNYVLWFHADGISEEYEGLYGKAKSGVAVSKSPFGPFKFLKSAYLNTHPDYKNSKKDDYRPGMARDFTIYQENELAYIIYASEQNATLYISRLNEDYTALAAEPENAVPGVDYICVYKDESREAPAIFKKDGKLYLMTSGCTGWDPNPSRYAVADDILGQWRDMGDPFVGDPNKNSFHTQSAYFFRAIGTEKVYYLGDRWFKDKLHDSRNIMVLAETDGDKLVIKMHRE